MGALLKLIRGGGQTNVVNSDLAPGEKVIDITLRVNVYGECVVTISKNARGYRKQSALCCDTQQDMIAFMTGKLWNILWFAEQKPRESPTDESATAA